MGGWLLVVVFFRDMVFKDRAGSDMVSMHHVRGGEVFEIGGAIGFRVKSDKRGETRS